MVRVCVPVLRYEEGYGAVMGTPIHACPHAALLSLQEEDIEYYDSKADTEFVSAVSTVSTTIPLLRGCTRIAVTHPQPWPHHGDIHPWSCWASPCAAAEVSKIKAGI